jgi:hypothetical protein
VAEFGPAFRTHPRVTEGLVAQCRHDAEDAKMQSEEPIDDLDAFIASRTDQELRAYGESFGKGSREWMIAEQELERRRYPIWARIGQYALLALGLWAIARRLF